MTGVIANQSGAPDTGPLVTEAGLLLIIAVAALLVAVLLIVLRFRNIAVGAMAVWSVSKAASGSILAPSPPLTATGGDWRAVDGTQLVVTPDGSHSIRLEYTPNESFVAAGVRAVLRAREAWWTHSGEATSQSVEQAQTLMEVPATLAVPDGFEKGRTIPWDVQFTLAGDVPSTCGDWRFLSCDWLLAVSVDRLNHPDARFEQPIIVTQPRDRLNAGVIDESEFGRNEEAAGTSGALRVDFRVRPAPLDLAAAAVAELAVANDGQPIEGCDIRLEIRMYATGIAALSNDWVIWQDLAPIYRLPVGQTEPLFEIPAINRPCPDMDLPHGRLRGKLRLVVDTGGFRDMVVERDLCLCLNKPGLAAG